MDTTPAPAVPAAPDAAVEAAGRGILALAGAASMGLGVAVAHLLAALTDPERSPLPATASAVIDLTPRPVEQLAVQTLGNADKPVLVAVLGVGVLALGALAGVLARRSRALGAGLVLVVALVAAVAALTRPGAVVDDALPSVIGGLTGAAALWVVARPRPVLPGTAPGALPRRDVLRASLWVLGGAAVLGAAGGLVARQAARAAEVLRSVVLPKPVDAAGPLPADVELGVDGVTPFTTPNADFYRVDTALLPPRVDPAGWTLTVDGMVRSPFTLTFDELLAMPMVERDVTLTCVSNEVGGPYAGNARWLGVRLADLMARAGIDPAAEQLLSTSVDGWTASTPVSVALDGRDALVAVGMNGEPLPALHGFPARLVVPGLYGFVSATKWVTRITATTYADQAAYWTQRGWATDAPVRTMARIDVPAPLSSVPAGKVAIGGVCWAQHRGIEGVEVQVDDGPWVQAKLGGAPTDDTWRQWVRVWDAAPGRHTLRVRATDGTGATQPEARQDPFPSGATGWHEVVVQVV